MQWIVLTWTNSTPQASFFIAEHVERSREEQLLPNGLAEMVFVFAKHQRQQISRLTLIEWVHASHDAGKLDSSAERLTALITAGH